MGSRIALHCLGPQQSWKPGNLSWASRWGCPQLWGVRGGHHLWARLGGAMGRKGGAMGAGLAPSTSLGWDLAWQHRAWPAAAGTEGGSPWKGVSLRSGWVCAEVAGRAVVPEGRACQGVGCLDGTMSRILGELRVPGCGSGLAPGRFWGGGVAGLLRETQGRSSRDGSVEAVLVVWGRGEPGRTWGPTST